MASRNPRPDLRHSFYRHYTDLFERAVEAEMVIPKMKHWCNEFWEKVLWHFGDEAAEKYEEDFEKMKCEIKECNTKVHKKLKRINAEAFYADLIYDFFDPVAFEEWMKIKAAIEILITELEKALPLFYKLQTLFHEFKTEIEQKCRTEDEDF